MDISYRDMERACSHAVLSSGDWRGRKIEAVDVRFWPVCVGTREGCYLSRFGRCSLDLDVSEVRLISRERPEVLYCRKLARKLCSREWDDYKSVVDFDRDNGIYVHSCCRCGHFDVYNGNHRVCIARRLGLVLPVLVFRDGDRPCRFCDVYYDEGVPEVSLYVGRHDVFSRRVGVELPPARFYLSVLPPVGGSDFTTFGGYEIPKVD